MNIINYLSGIAVPLTVLLIITYAIIEKNKVFDMFLEGAKSGIKIVISIFPTLLGLFLAINLLNESGLTEGIIKIIKPILLIAHIPTEIFPLAILRPISGSASMAIATNIMKKYGVDTNIGLIASTIMGATETTIYTVALYTSSVGIKKTRFVLISALLADFVGMITAVIFWQIMS